MAKYSPSDPAAWPTFQFDRCDRDALSLCLQRYVTDIGPVIAALERDATTFVQALQPETEKFTVSTRGNKREEAKLASAGERLRRRIAGLSERSLDRIQDVKLTVLRDLAKELDALDDVVAVVSRENKTATNGRPRQTGRLWLVKQVRRSLEQHGMTVTNRAGARSFARCLRIVLKAVKEKPADIRPLLRASR